MDLSILGDIQTWTDRSGDWLAAHGVTGEAAHQWALAYWDGLRWAIMVSAVLILISSLDDLLIDLAYWMGQTVPNLIVGDITRLRQIFVNLVGNAVKFTDRGEVVIHVEAKPHTTDDESNALLQSSGDDAPSHHRHQDYNAPLYDIHFAVRDTGIGIPSDRMDRLFKSFSQVDSSTTRQYGGTGLGLAIS